MGHEYPLLSTGILYIRMTLSLVNLSIWAIRHNAQEIPKKVIS